MVIVDDRDKFVHTLAAERLHDAELSQMRSESIDHGSHLPYKQMPRSVRTSPACCSGALIGTKRMFGRCTASQIACVPPPNRGRLIGYQFHGSRAGGRSRPQHQERTVIPTCFWLLHARTRGGEYAVHATTEEVPAERLIIERSNLQNLPAAYRGRSARTVMVVPERSK